jgi:hypothetical protein
MSRMPGVLALGPGAIPFITGTSARTGRRRQLPPEVDDGQWRLPRGRQGMTLVAAALSSREIGEPVFVAPATAETHANGLGMLELGARDKRSTRGHPLRAGLVRAGEPSS